MTEQIVKIMLVVLFVLIVLLVIFLVVYTRKKHIESFTNSQEFDGQTVLITGGTTGIGLATALEFAKKGANVLVGGRSEWKWKNVSIPFILSNSPESLSRIIYKKLDVRNVQSQYNFFSFGYNINKRLDIVFNNAGVALGSTFGLTGNTISISPEQKITLEINTLDTSIKNCKDNLTPQWVFSGETIVKNRLDRNNVCGPNGACKPAATALNTQFCENGIITDEFGQMISCKMAVGFMRGDDYMKLIGEDPNIKIDASWGNGNPKNVEGIIINTSSINALIAAPGAMDYSISKAASVMLTRTMAVEQSSAFIKSAYMKDLPTIRVNGVLPGPVDTPLMRGTAPPGTACPTSYPEINGIKWKDDGKEWLEEAKNNWNDKLEAIYKRELNTIFASTMPNNYMGRPTDIANIVVFLGNKNSRFINGATIIADGGMQTTWGTVPLPVECP